MKTYSMSFAAAIDHKPANPERTASRSCSGMNFDVVFQIWTSRAAMLKTIEMQGKREHRQTDWRPCKIPASAI